MIEKSIAVDHLDAILARARELGVDMTQWGPADFSFSRGEPSLQHSEAIKPFEALVIQKSLEYGIHPRIELGSVEQAKRYIDMGVRHFCIGWDRFILRQQLVSSGYRHAQAYRPTLTRADNYRLFEYRLHDGCHKFTPQLR